MNEDIYYPRKVLSDTNLSVGARLLYGVIFTRAMATGICDMTNQQLGDSICLSKLRASSLVSELVRKNYLERIIVRDEKNNEVLSRKLIPLVS